MSDEPNAFESWGIVELMGHVRMAGRITEEERFGGKVGRVDVPRGETEFTTVYFTSQSIYRITPTTEEVARHVAKQSQVRPVHLYELPAPASVASGEFDDDDDDSDDELDDHPY